MNVELLQKVRDAIADEGTPFDMGTWGVGVSATTWWMEDYDSEPSECNTPACVAGWAIRLSPLKRRDGPGRCIQRGVKAKASRLLGLGPTPAYQPLFRQHMWPPFARDLPERQGALALLDALIAGQDPWSDDYVGAM